MHIQQFLNEVQATFSVNILIEQCNFSNNIATTYCCESSSSFGYGGGLTLSLNHSSGHTNVTVKDSNFWNNSASAGGAIEVTICNSKNSSFFFGNISFDDNEARDEGGGALDILWSPMHNSRSSMLIKDANFSRNYATYGGGSAIAIASNSNTNCIKFTGCIWKENIALYGSALDIFPEKMSELQLIPHIQIADSKFTNNSNCYAPCGEYVYKQGFGVIMITGYKLLIRGTVTFSSNIGSCIFAVGSEVIFIEADVWFKENVAEYGTGISLIGLSIITTKENCNFQFCSNRAEKIGPTMYYYPINKHNFILSKRYLFEAYNQKDGNDHFQLLGNSILQNLKYIDSKDKTVNFINSDVLRGLNLTASNNCRNNSKKPISTSIQIPKCRVYGKYPNSNRNQILFVPGIERELNISQNPGVFRMTLYRYRYDTVEFPDIYEYISNKLKLNGCPGSEVFIYLHGLGFEGIHYQIPSKLTGCPPLHKLSKDYQCQCYTSSDSYFSTSSYKCDHTTNYSYSSIVGGYWVGYENSSDNLHRRFLMGHCPTGFCNQGSNDSYWLTLPFRNGVYQDELDEVICNGRRGILCGKCRNGTTVYIHSRTFKCGNTDKCGIGALLFLLAEIIPITAIFLVLILLKIKLTTGGLTGYIFFAQMYESVNIKLEGYIKHGITYNYTAFHHLVYQFFNFDFSS